MMTFNPQAWWNTTTCAEFLDQRHRDGTLDLHAVRKLLDRFPDKVRKSRLYGRSVRYWGEDVIALPQLAHAKSRERIVTPARVTDLRAYLGIKRKEKGRNCA